MCWGQGRVHRLSISCLFEDLLKLVQVISQVIEHRLLRFVVLHLQLKCLNLALLLLDSLLMHFILELKTAKDLTCVALEDVQLLHNHLVIGTFIRNLVQFVVKAQVLKTRQKLRLLLF